MYKPNQNHFQRTQTYSKVNAKKKQKKNTSKKKSATSFWKFWASERMIQLYGVIFMLFSLFLTVSLISYSKDIISNVPQEKFVEENWAGLLGTKLAMAFANNIFGMYSIGFSLLFFIIGFKLTFNKILLSIWKTGITSIVTMAWLSMTTALFVMGTEYADLSGKFGIYLSECLMDAGLLISILTVLVTFLIIAVLFYNLSIPKAAHQTVEIARKFKNSSIFQKKEFIRKEKNQENAEIYKYNKNTELPGLYIENQHKLEEEYNKNKIHFEMNDGNISVENTKNITGDTDKKEEEVEFNIVDGNLCENESKKTNDFDGFENENDIISDGENETDEEDVSTVGGSFMMEDYDPRKDLSFYRFPTTDLLKEYVNKESSAEVLRQELLENKSKIETTLKNFDVKIKSITATVGPTVTLYEIVPADGVRISKIKNLEDDIALSLAALGIRIIAPIPGRGTIGIEVPNKNPKIVSMAEIISSEKFQNNKFDLPIGLGKTISNEPFVVDLAKMPHLLMAGATGQGKSVGLNAIITSLLYHKHPSELKFVMIDPKKVEFSLYSTIEKHYLAKLPDNDEPIITDTKKVIRTLNSLCKEMDNRYALLKLAKTRNIKEYNAKFCIRKLSPVVGHRYLPYIVLLIDEFGDLIMTAGREVEMPIARLAQLARAIGIHLIIATQRPSVNIITGTIKANFPARIAFRVSSKIDSRTILDGSGADQLIGKGDMLISTGSDLIRLQCAFVDTPEVENIVKFIEDQQAYPEPFLLPDVPDEEKGKSDLGNDDNLADGIDECFVEAARLLVQTQQGSTSLIQRKLSLGYNRAGRIMDQLADLGIVGPSQGSKAREVKIKTLADLDAYLMEKRLL
jgi:S-DNA-T family DNA segregation ATPase FtsK/SpoIIIE